jgi:hypothetical protein
MLALEWTREQRRILLPVQILHPFPVSLLTGIGATALLDTGSSISGVALALAERLGLHRLGKLPLTSAQGLGQVERYAFRVGLLPGGPADRAPSFPFVFDEVVGIELTNTFEFNALIGMDVLNRCDFSMERSGRCRLRFG